MQIIDNNKFLQTKKIFNIDQFRTSQEEIIKHVLDGKHCLVLMPTGMGKSLCYQFPALLLDGLTVVLSPLISLMKDQVDQLLKLNIDSAYINSSLSKSERERIYNNVASGQYKIIFVSPERFRKDNFLSCIEKRKISLLAVDEAHCVSQWGHDFRPDYSKIKDFREMLKFPTTIALTATATPRVQKDIIEKTGISPLNIRIYNEGICRPNLFLKVDEVIDETEKFSKIYNYIKSSHETKIVYFNLIQSIERFSSFLDIKKEKYYIYHGRLDPNKKRSVQKKFQDAESCLMLATNAFGMGIDKKDIRMIIHAEIPDSIESYYQEIGRGGRDGKATDCILIYDQSDLAVQIDFLEWKNPDADFIIKVFTLLKSLGNNVNSYEYEELQEKLVYKNKSDHRLQTVLNIFERHNITTGSLDAFNLKLVSSIHDNYKEIITNDYIKMKREVDKARLIDMLNYVKTADCRRSLIHNYFNIKAVGCNNCDNCRQAEFN